MFVTVSSPTSHKSAPYMREAPVSPSWLPADVEPIWRGKSTCVSVYEVRTLPVVQLLLASCCVSNLLRAQTADCLVLPYLRPDTYVVIAHICWTTTTSMLDYARLGAGLGAPLCWSATASVLDYDYICAGLCPPLCWTRSTSLVEYDCLCAGLRPPLCWTMTASVLPCD